MENTRSVLKCCLKLAFPNKKEKMANWSYQEVFLDNLRFQAPPLPVPSK